MSGINANAFLAVYGLPCLLRFTSGLSCFKAKPDFSLGRLSIPLAVLGALYGAFSNATIALPAFYPISAHQPAGALLSSLIVGACYLLRHKHSQLRAHCTGCSHLAGDAHDAVRTGLCAVRLELQGTCAGWYGRVCALSRWLPGLADAFGLQRKQHASPRHWDRRKASAQAFQPTSPPTKSRLPPLSRLQLWLRAW